MKSQIKTTVKQDDIVCLNCLRPLAGFSLSRTRRDRYGRVIRVYMGSCTACGLDVEVMQFYAPECPAGPRWSVHKFRYWQRLVSEPQTSRPGYWQIVQELPEPPVAITGPGGEYDSAMEPEIIDIAKKVRSTMVSAARLLGDLVTALEAKRK